MSNEKDNTNSTKEAARVALMHARIAYAAHSTPDNLKALQSARRAYSELRDWDEFDKALEAGRTVLK